MSYRTFKRLLGEASLERKCRFLFGGGLMLLITGSFYVYGRLTVGLVYDQNRMTGRQLIAPIILESHWKWFETDGEFSDVIDSLAKDVKPVDLQDYHWDLVRPTGNSDGRRQPKDQVDHEVLHEMGLGKGDEVTRIQRDKREYQYYGAVRAAKSCLRCHTRSDESTVTSREGQTVSIDIARIAPNPYQNSARSLDSDAFRALVQSVAESDAIDPLMVRPKKNGGYELIAGERRLQAAREAGMKKVPCKVVQMGEPLVKEGDLLGMVKVAFPLEATERDVAWNNAILIATAIVTAFLAMTGAYAIVRYVIVKPVLHLKDVSDAISRGNLDQRADIRTGDEYEELSQAFNRMLRHLVAAQEELRQVNGELDAKVDELAQANMRLFELNNLKNDFLATMTHELRTPLNSILGFSEVLSGITTLNDKEQRYARNIQSSGKDLLVLVNDILDLAKIEAGKMDLHLTEFSLNDLIERLIGMMRPLAEKRSIDVSCETDDSLSQLTQDQGKLQQILYNLLSNAVKFTPEGGRVQVTTRRVDNEEAEILVEDTGVGIPLEDQETIFEKFRQGNTSRAGRSSSLTREYAGTGLGLSIVKELSKLLGGEVSVQSEVGKGSIFTLRVPLVLKDQPRPLGEVLGLTSADAVQLKRIDRNLSGKTLNP